MPIKPVKRRLNTLDALYYEDLIYYLRKMGNLEYELNQETEERIRARFAETTEIQVTIEGTTQNTFNGPLRNNSIFLVEFVSYVTIILCSNNVSINEIHNMSTCVEMLKNYPEQLKQVIAGLEEKVKVLKANTPKLELVPKKQNI